MRMETKSTRALKRGDIVSVNGGGEEVVRKVSVIAHLANGQDQVYEAGVQIEVYIEDDEQVT